MLADRLVLHGWDAHFLGADTPVEEIAAAARELRADVVALSAATHYNRMLLRDVLARLHRELPDVRVGVGGPAFANDPELAAEVLTEADLGLGPNAVDAQSGA
jgi:methanogenic corrinoid protein MtbC1